MVMSHEPIEFSCARKDNPLFSLSLSFIRQIQTLILMCFKIKSVRTQFSPLCLATLKIDTPIIFSLLTPIAKSKSLTISLLYLLPTNATWQAYFSLVFFFVSKFIPQQQESPLISSHTHRDILVRDRCRCLDANQRAKQKTTRFSYA